MEQTREDETQKATNLQREWMVEYEVANKDGIKQKHLTILYGKNVVDVQESLFIELRALYPHQSMIEVTITRFEPVSTHTSKKYMNSFSGFIA